MPADNNGKAAAYTVFGRPEQLLKLFFVRHKLLLNINPVWMVIVTIVYVTVYESGLDPKGQVL